jgi:hypothetical protein
MAMIWLNAQEGMTVNSEKVQAGAWLGWRLVDAAGWPTPPGGNLFRSRRAFGLV